MLRPVLAAAAFATLAAGAYAQQVVSAKAGMVHYVEGSVTLDGQPVSINAKAGKFPSMKDDSIVRTELGRAEILLAPGMLLRVGEDSSVRMLKSELTDIRVELLTGAMLLEVTEAEKENAVTLRFKDVTVTPARSGIYRLEADPAELRVWEGRADVIAADKKIEIRKGRFLKLDGEQLAVSKFDTEHGDSLYRWSSRRSGYLAMANVSAARSLRDSGFDRGPSRWYWNPYFGMFTFIPGINTIYSPFGYGYYSPRYVYIVYRPRVQMPSAMAGGGGMGGPVYNPNLGYSTASSRSYGGYTGAPATAPAAAASAPAPSPRSAESAAPRTAAGGGRGQ